MAHCKIHIALISGVLPTNICIAVMCWSLESYLGKFDRYVMLLGGGLVGFVTNRFRKMEGEVV